MKVLFDTSVLVAALVEAHPGHEIALPWLQRVRTGELEMILSAHSLAELYAVLSSLPVKPRISPATALMLIEANILKLAKVISLSGSDYRNCLNRMARYGIGGGVVYDALIAAAAAKEKVDCLVTTNKADFLRVWPEGNEIIVSP